MAFLVIAVAAAAALVAVVVWVGRHVGAPVRVALLALALLAGIWAGGFALMSRGWKDTDGWIDCNTYCHGWHYAGASLFWIPPITAVILLVALAATTARARSRHSPA
jgi:hypothetical protein